jgi:hypothetical protein
MNTHVSPQGFQFNTGLAKVAVQCSAGTFVVNQSLVLRINICGENRHLRQARKRYQKPFEVLIWNDSAKINQKYQRNQPHILAHLLLL